MAEIQKKLFKAINQNPAFANRNNVRYVTMRNVNNMNMTKYSKCAKILNNHNKGLPMTNRSSRAMLPICLSKRATGAAMQRGAQATRKGMMNAGAAMQRGAQATRKGMMNAGAAMQRRAQSTRNAIGRGAQAMYNQGARFGRGVQTTGAAMQRGAGRIPNRVRGAYTGAKAGFKFGGKSREQRALNLNQNMRKRGYMQSGNAAARKAGAIWKGKAAKAKYNRNNAARKAETAKRQAARTRWTRVPQLIQRKKTIIKPGYAKCENELCV